MISRPIFQAFVGLAFLATILAACAPTRPITTNIQNTANAIVLTPGALTQTALSTFTSTATVVVIQPTPLPTQPPFFPFLTPDAIQVEHWKEYQNALAKRFIYSSYVSLALCEWDILGRAEQEVYVWVVCATPGYEANGPAVTHMGSDGSIQNVEAPVHGSTWNSDIDKMFPSDVQENITSYDARGKSLEMLTHIKWRQTHPEEPPLIVLSATVRP